MAHTKIILSNGVELKPVPLGFSWTVFFWGPIPAAIRGDWAWAVGLLIANLCSYGIAGVIVAFFYNKTYAKALFNKGYKIHSLPNGYTEDNVKNELGLVALP